MTVRFIPTIPAGCTINESAKADEVSSNNKNASLMQDNFELLTSPVTGADGVTYTWVDDKHREGWVNSIGRARGNISGSQDTNTYWGMKDKVGQHGAYICKLGFGKDKQHRFLPNVVGFDINIAQWGSSTASTNDPWIGKIGMIYLHPLTGSEFIYNPSVSIKGPGGIIPHKDNKSYTRVARKIAKGSTGWNDIHEQDLRFTGFIWEWGHSRGGGAVETTIYLAMNRFKPITSLHSSEPVYDRYWSSVRFMELVPKMRSFSEINNVEYDTLTL